MPREKQKRGRRAEDKSKKEQSKRKRDEAPEDSAAKRLKSTTTEAAVDTPNEPSEAPDYTPLRDGEPAEHEHPSNDRPFHGLPDTEEQEYLPRANEVLELNQFEDAEERRLFVHSVYQEANDKELKLACSQSCSRLMEKLISS